MKSQSILFFNISRNYLFSLLSRILILSIVIIYALNFVNNKSNNNSGGTISYFQSLQDTRQINTADLLRVLKLKKYFLIDLRKRDDITVSDAMTSAVFYDQAIKNDLLIKIKTSVITIVYGNGVELSEVKAKAEALENESGIPIYYYNDGIETWNSLKDFFKNDEK